MKERAVLTGRYFMSGDDACAEGAMAAGCRYFGGYPITPSTEIAERLSRRLPEVGGVYMQMEDELGSIASVLGASAAGARAMTATSGPGFSLMMENLGLGVILELPCVIVNIQRGSPSTGLPTMTGQSEVMQARWGSHGDYALVAYAPWSPQEIFELTILAFNVADRYRVPVIVLGDEVIGHMVERVTIPPAEQIPHWERKGPAHPPEFYVNERFKSFRADEDDLVPPIAHAGEGYRVHFTGLTHNEIGYPEITPETHDKLVRRLIAKIQHNTDQIIRTEGYYLEDAEVVVISYGCTARSARRAVREAREVGIPVGFLRLISLWPFPETQIKELARTVKKFIVAEMNLGQMRLEVERCVQHPVYGVHHAGGELITPERIRAAIREMVNH
ncbi:MAG: 2-oxoacid:acceptor oxidoreductase subunit alpha [Chloroflexota bacterium]|nr:2-oxoacid:acceptor oxidoreductase subunit alpha [Chloroflexota bacterium]